jgi:hypothetical protein
MSFWKAALCQLSTIDIFINIIESIIISSIENNG